ncbi:MAG TPA: hypothetical protein VLF71_01950 [Candidatus Saccharimonadales bacterium]|nr:hypothetical protein [Candidatus Saccharimonadales bacterium]
MEHQPSRKPPMRYMLWLPDNNLLSDAVFVDMTFPGADGATVLNGINELMSLVEERAAETYDAPLSDDVPVFVAPITEVTLQEDPSIVLSLDARCLRGDPEGRAQDLRSFCTAIGCFVLDVPHTADLAEFTPGGAPVDPVFVGPLLDTDSPQP